MAPRSPTNPILSVFQLQNRLNHFQPTLRYTVKLVYVMSCCFMVCYDRPISCYVMSCYVIHGMICHFLLCYFIVFCDVALGFELGTGNEVPPVWKFEFWTWV